MTGPLQNAKGSLLAASMDAGEAMTPNAAVIQSVLICPHCGTAKQETMPTDACLFFYECEECKTVLRPKPGDCCVFCSYGSVKCPPLQAQRSCCDRYPDIQPDAANPR